MMNARQTQNKCGGVWVVKRTGCISRSTTHKTGHGHSQTRDTTCTEEARQSTPLTPLSHGWPDISDSPGLGVDFTETIVTRAGGGLIHYQWSTIPLFIAS